MRSVSMNEFVTKFLEEFNNSKDMMKVQCAKCGKLCQEELELFSHAQQEHDAKNHIEQKFMITTGTLKTANI